LPGFTHGDQQTHNQTMPNGELQIALTICCRKVAGSSLPNKNGGQKTFTFAPLTADFQT